MTPSPVHMDEKYWCQPQKSLWFRKNESFSNYTPDVTCPNCLKVVDGSVGDDVVVLQLWPTAAGNLKRS